MRIKNSYRLIVYNGAIAVKFINYIQDFRKMIERTNTKDTNNKFYYMESFLLNAIMRLFAEI